MILKHRLAVATAVVLVAISAVTLFLDASPTSAVRLARLPAGGSVQPATANGSFQVDGGSHPRKLPKLTIELQAPTTQEEFVASLRTIVPDSNVHRQRKALLDLMEYLTPDNALAVREELQKLKQKGFGSDFAWWAFCTRWGEIDPQGALAYFRVNPSDPGASTAANHIMEGWVAIDDRGARTWLAENKDSPLFRDALWSYTTNMALRDLGQATSDVFGMNLDPEALLNNIGPLVKSARDRGGFEGVANWFDGLADAQKNAAFEHAMWAMKDAELTTSTAWFEANADKPWRNDKHFHYLASRYAAQDPKGAIDWVLTLPDDPGRPGIPAGLSTIMDVWTVRNSREAGVWLNEHSDEQWWARAAMGHYRSLVRNNPALADGFITGLPPERRGAVLQQLEGE